MTATTDSENISGANIALACGSIGTEKRRNPYAPIFSSTPARITDPAVGASTCASGSQVCTGHIGTLTANEARKARNSQVCSPGANWVCSSTVMSVVPAWNHIASSASSISTEPVSVNKKNLNAEYTRRGPPQTPMIRN